MRRPPFGSEVEVDEGIVGPLHQKGGGGQEDEEEPQAVHPVPHGEDVAGVLAEIGLHLPGEPGGDGEGEEKADSGTALPREPLACGSL